MLLPSVLGQLLTEHTWAWLWVHRPGLHCWHPWCWRDTCSHQGFVGIVSEFSSVINHCELVPARQPGYVLASFLHFLAGSHSLHALTLASSDDYRLWIALFCSIQPQDQVVYQTMAEESWRLCALWSPLLSDGFAWRWERQMCAWVISEGSGLEKCWSTQMLSTVLAYPTSAPGSFGENTPGGLRQERRKK